MLGAAFLAAIAFVVGAGLLGLQAARTAPTAMPGPPPVPRDQGVVGPGAGGVRIGRPGDVVVTGRWMCGPATPALLRPATGEVFRFDDWARPGHDVSAIAVATVPGATEVRARAAPATGCDDLEVLRREGPPVRFRSTVAG